MLEDNRESYFLHEMLFNVMMHCFNSQRFGPELVVRGSSLKFCERVVNGTVAEA
jgi:hypothetical protein